MVNKFIQVFPSRRGHLTFLLACIIPCLLFGKNSSEWRRPLDPTVFQYRQTFLDNKDREREAFLWIPAGSSQVRGIIASGMTLMEREMSQDPLIRKACADQDLAILFSTVGIGSVDLNGLLQGFAEISGYRELPYAPLMFVGHSAGGPPSGILATTLADRCFGLVQYRGGGPGNSDLPPGVPSLMMVGQYDEFGGTMRDADDRESWQSSVEHITKYRAKSESALCTIMIDPGRGHFAWSRKNSKFLALWIKKAAESRIPKSWPANTDDPITAREVNYSKGFLFPMEAISNASEDQLYLAGQFPGNVDSALWLFDRELAEAWIEYHAGQFNKKDQFLEWKDPYEVESGTRFYFTDIAWTGPDSFVVHPQYSKVYPSQIDGKGPVWIEHGQAVGHSCSPIRLKHVSGPVKWISDNKFRIHFNALTPPFGGRQRVTFMAYSEGDEKYRYTERVGMLPHNFFSSREGLSQIISFPDIPDVTADTEPLKLKATADSGLPVHYYVQHGPATILGSTLEIQQIPHRASYPIEVTVVAWQSGNALAPRIKAAEPVKQTFLITGP